MNHSQLIRKKAMELGFTAVGFSKADFLEDEARHLEIWLNSNKNGKMSYMENHFDMRLNPTLLVSGAKSVISFLYNYFPTEVQSNTDLKISKYAYGEDYHFVIKDKLKELLSFIQSEIGDVNGRAFVDSAPVLEKAWAKKSGLGWIGKNSNLISKSKGSFFFLSELIIDLELEYDSAKTDHCGSCTACIDACPTQAITPYSVDGSKCISYFTIELRDEIPLEMKGKFENWMFGCDICMDVCPWNRFSKPHQEQRFQMNSIIKDYTVNDWKEITEDVFVKYFKDSPLKRSKYNGIKRNIDFILGLNPENKN
jgi:epoxyqueuosine reductase